MSTEHVARKICDRCGRAEHVPLEDADNPPKWWVMVSWRGRERRSDVLSICQWCMDDFKVWRNSFKEADRG